MFWLWSLKEQPPVHSLCILFQRLSRKVCQLESAALVWLHRFTSPMPQLYISVNVGPC